MSVEDVIDGAESAVGCESCIDILSMAFAGEIEGLARDSCCWAESGVNLLRLLVRLAPGRGLGVLAAARSFWSAM